ncbi:response regulator transcription factor [Paenibacillus apiarius]|uniref:response regulator transcription factor n=1 Tax=Paenibacillus apiarius TaxID=46240 RepID=UPI00197DD2CE|nr:hypothetical protein [Paenibacillus apiarius]MBN3522904.1 hypothetical protein [Paenibacillus apiarius]
MDSRAAFHGAHRHSGGEERQPLFVTLMCGCAMRHKWRADRSCGERMLAMISVLIADDDAFIRESLKLIVRMHPDIDVIGTCGNGKEAERAVTELGADVVLMDPDVARKLAQLLQAPSRAKKPESMWSAYALTATEQTIIERVAVFLLEAAITAQTPLESPAAAFFGSGSHTFSIQRLPVNM